MRILHTSDWHLGKMLLDTRRTEEFDKFSAWLLGVIKEKGVDVLLVSGDIFDTTTPSATAKKQYCDFLAQASEAGCRQVVITAGNHDSMAQLEVEQSLLRRMNVRVVSSLTRERAAECLVPVGDELLVCAVPFLRPEVARAVSADDEAARQTAYTDGVADVLAEVARLAEEWKQSHPAGRVICMAHQAVVGAVPTSSTRSLIGTLDVLPAAAFPAVFDYVALGHIHKCYALQAGRMHYSGSPLPMATDEGDIEHCMLMTEPAADGGFSVETLTVPAFTKMVNRRIATREEADALARECRRRVAENPEVPLWLNLEYTGADLTQAELRACLREQLEETAVPVIVIRKAVKSPVYSPAGGENPAAETLADYSPERVFEMKLQQYEEQNGAFSPEKRDLLIKMFEEVCHLATPAEHEN